MKLAELAEPALTLSAASAEEKRLTLASWKASLSSSSSC